MSIYHQLKPVHESVVQAQADARAERDQTFSEKLYRALTAMGVDPGYIEGSRYIDDLTKTTIELVADAATMTPAFSERTTAQGTRLNFTLFIQALLDPQMIEQCHIEGVKPPEFSRKIQVSLNEAQEDNLIDYQTVLHAAIHGVIQERENWVVAWMSRDSAPEPETEFNQLLNILARLLKPHLDALEG